MMISAFDFTACGAPLRHPGPRVARGKPAGKVLRRHRPLGSSVLVESRSTGPRPAPHRGAA